jgi:hypothetical protein
MHPLFYKKACIASPLDKTETDITGRILTHEIMPAFSSGFYHLPVDLQ